jgi:serine/threonine-protein kinase
MPYVEGETLRAKLNRETQFGVDEAVRIAREVADALDYAHRHGVIHRDIKPENILLHDGRPMVADFGIALAVSAAAGGRMTETGLSLGTPHYMSPEQATAEKEISARADVYSLASVLYEMLTGEPPHMGNSAQQIIMKIIADVPRPVTELRKAVPPHVAAAVAKALEKLPADRFPSAAAFAEALGNPAFTTGAVGGSTVAGGPSKQRRLIWTAVAALLGVIGLANIGLLLRGPAKPPEVVRFTLGFPGNHRLDLQGDEDVPFALSPDGTQIAYGAIDSSTGARRLYIRRLDQLEGTPLQGTEDAVAPFFSPDGLWVAFVTEEDEKLKKVPATGGPAITLADDVPEAVASGSWGDDGFIVYTAAPGPHLARVRGTGGVPERIRSDSTGLGGLVRMLWPSVLPGGEAVLFTRCEGNCLTRDLVVVDVATGAVTVMVPGATRGWYVATGHLIYATDNGAVYAVPFDPETRTVQGSPVPVLDQVQAGFANGSRMAISPAGHLIYVPGIAQRGVQVVEVDRSGRETVVISRFGQFRQPRWSPSRDRIAVTVTDEKGAQIWIYDVASATLSQLTFEGSNVRPTWSPDGARVAYWSFRTEGQSGLYWVPADRSGPEERVVDGEVIGASTTYWTRDGAWIVIDGDHQDSTRADEDIFAVETGAGHKLLPAVATPADEQTGTVSPDGKWIAYNSGEGGQWQVYLRPFLRDGGRWLISTGPGTTPLWTSNTEVVYIDPQARKLTAARLELGATVRVTSREPLFGWESYRINNSTPDYDASHDGQRFLVLRGIDAMQRGVEPIVVLNWFEDVKRRMAAQGGRPE